MGREANAVQQSYRVEDQQCFSCHAVWGVGLMEPSALNSVVAADPFGSSKVQDSTTLTSPPPCGSCHTGLYRVIAGLYGVYIRYMSVICPMFGGS